MVTDGGNTSSAVILVWLKFSSVTNLVWGWQKSEKEKGDVRVAPETQVSNLYTVKRVQNSRDCSWTTQSEGTLCLLKECR